MWRAHQHVALDQAAPSDLLAQAQVAEIGDAGIDQDVCRSARVSDTCCRRFHLRHQLGNVFQTRSPISSRRPSAPRRSGPAA